jgi:5'-nucleotidase
LFGIPAIAFSQTEKGWAHIDAAARRAREMVEQLLPSVEVLAAGVSPTVPPWLLNVNIPNLPYDQLKATKVARLGRRHAAERVITQTSPRGETMYWIGGAGPAKDEGEGTDFHATKQGFVVVTPLHVDLTDHERLPYWSQTFANMPAATKAAA